MYEKRRSKRLPVKLELEISSLFKQDNVFVNNINAPIEVINVSKTGIGFKTTSILPLDFYFNAKLELGDATRALYTVVRIVRSELCDDHQTIYGCEFEGMAPALTYIFDEYEKELQGKGVE